MTDSVKLQNSSKVNNRSHKTCSFIPTSHDRAIYKQIFLFSHVCCLHDFSIYRKTVVIGCKAEDFLWRSLLSNNKENYISQNKYRHPQTDSATQEKYQKYVAYWLKIHFKIYRSLHIHKSLKIRQTWQKEHPCAQQTNSTKTQ